MSRQRNKEATRGTRGGSTPKELFGEGARGFGRRQVFIRQIRVYKGKQGGGVGQPQRVRLDVGEGRDRVGLPGHRAEG